MSAWGGDRRILTFAKILGASGRHGFDYRQVAFYNPAPASLPGTSIPIK